MSDDPKCAKCGGGMERGFLASRSLDYTKPDDWVSGAPETSLWFGTKVRSKEHHQLSAYRCRDCGYVEFYALPE
ncbi:MAG TPA: PF20097 family protein [Chthoniobacterales bacterium]|jgi:hypothetical protein|nr:PF20097 family protein [Chthoniobacterales bacterium]